MDLRVEVQEKRGKPFQEQIQVCIRLICLFVVKQLLSKANKMEAVFQSISRQVRTDDFLVDVKEIYRSKAS
jgi:hypothetical protein